MTSTDFWNLAGRAGRLREEFSGNVWCIEKDTWKEDPLEGPRLGTITSSFRNVLSDPIESTRLVQCIENKNLPSDLKSISELAFGKIFSEFTLPGRKLEDSIYTSTVNPVFLRQIDERCELVKQKAVLPADIFHRNSAISPWRLEAIRERLAAIADINSVVPIKPTVRGSCEILRRVFQIIDEVFFMTKNNSYTYFAALAFRWINGDTLSEIIENELNFRKIDKTDSKAINKKIRGLFDDLENQLQFRYARYLKAYVDIVEVILRTRGMNDKANDIAPMHLYIELGTYNSVMITLMSLGLSRTTSILLWRSVAKRWPPSPQECMANLLILNRKMVVLPDVCWREISDIVGS